MPSAIDATKPADGEAASKAALRANLAAAKSEIEDIQDLHDFYVDNYGAVGDGTTDDATSIQTAINAMAAVGAGNLIFTPGKDYRINAGLVIPKGINEDYRMEIKGLGATLSTTNAIVMLSRELPADNGEALSMVNAVINVSGLTFDGNNVGIGLIMSCTYGATFDSLHFIDCDESLELRFCLGARVVSCKSTNGTTKAFICTFGNWSGATTANSPSNVTTFDHCRVFGKTGMHSHFYVEGCSGVVLSGCITEGQNPIDAVVFEDRGATVVKDFTVRDHHAENAPANAVFRVDLFGGTFTIDGLFAQIQGNILVDATGSSTNATYKLNRLHYIHNSYTLKAVSVAAPAWMFSQRGQIQIDWSSPDSWEGGVVGRHLEFDVTSSSNVSTVAARGGSLRLESTQFIDILGDMRISGSVAATSVGSVAFVYEVRDPASNVVLGYIPVYDTFSN